MMKLPFMEPPPCCTVFAQLLCILKFMHFTASRPILTPYMWRTCDISTLIASYICIQVSGFSFIFISINNTSLHSLGAHSVPPLHMDYLCKFALLFIPLISLTPLSTVPFSTYSVSLYQTVRIITQHHTQ